MAESHFALTVWEPIPQSLPPDWLTLAEELTQQVKGSVRAYVLGVKYDAQTVGQLLHSWGLPWQVVMAGYLWEYDEEQIRRSNLQDNDGVLSHIRQANTYTQYIENENLPPLLSPPYRDLGALLVAFAIHYEALRTLQHQSNEQLYAGTMQTDIKRIGRTLLNMAKRLGMWKMKREIEDITERVRNPRKFAEAQQEHAAILKQDAILLEQIRQLLLFTYSEVTEQPLEVIYTPCGVAGLKRRMQDAHTTATSQKTKLTGLDLVTFEVMVPKVADCYTALGIFSQLGYIQDRVTDQLANPKPNGCSNLALGLILKKQAFPSMETFSWKDDTRIVCQLQISTPFLQAITNYGCLHPTYYKWYTSSLIGEENDLSIKKIMQNEEGRIFPAIKEILTDTSAQKDIKTPITVYDKNRHGIHLPEGATALDFAYAVDINIGEHAVEAFINSRKAPLKRVLDEGDIVEIRTSNEIQIQDYWIGENYAITSLALEHIRASLSQRADNADNAQQRGYDLLRQALEDRFITVEDLDYELHFLLDRYNMGALHLYLEQLAKEAEPPYNPEWAVEQIQQQIAERNDPLSSNNSTWMPTVDMHITSDKQFLHQQNCAVCNPSYPQDMRIVGLIHKRSGKLIVHKEDCSHLINRRTSGQPLLIPMSWQRQPPTLRVAFVIVAQDRKGLILDITKRLLQHRCNLQHINAEANSRSREAHIRFIIEAYTYEDVIDTWEKLANIENVAQVDVDPAVTPQPTYERLKHLYAPNSSQSDKASIEAIWRNTVEQLELRKPTLANYFDISRPAAPKMFFGRSEEMKQMQRALCEGENGKALALYGPLRSGKSSICKNFLARQVHPPLWSTLVSLQKFIGQSEETILKELAQQVCREFTEQLQQPAPSSWWDYEESNPQLRFKSVIQDCLQQVPSSRLVLALDEFGGAFESHKQNTLDYRFFLYWKELASEVSQLSFIFALPTSAHKLLTSELFANAFSFAESFPVHYLDKESARRLLVDPLRDQEIAIHPDTVEYAVRLAGGNPYYVTLIGMQLITLLNLDTNKQEVLNQDLDYVVEEIIAPGKNQHFSFHRKEFQNDDELHILQKFVDYTNHTQQSVVQLKKFAAWLNVPPNKIRPHLERLCNGLMLEVHTSQRSNHISTNPSFSFKVDLFRLWLERNHWFFSSSME